MGLLVRLALPEELEAMAAGEDVKETVMTIPFLQSCIANMIKDKDLERKTPTSSNKKQRLPPAEAPWKWFTSSELGFPLVRDKYERSIHPLVERFIDDKIGLPLAEEAEGECAPSQNTRRLRKMKQDWGSLQQQDLQLEGSERVGNRGRFSTSHIAKNPRKLPETNIANEDFESMITDPPEIGAVRVHMEPGGKDTTYGGIAADTFQGIATLTTPSRPFRMEGARWHLLSQIFSSPELIRSELERERTLQESMDKDKMYRSFS